MDSRLLDIIENRTKQEEQSPQQKWDVHTMLQDLNTPIHSLINLASTLDSSFHPKHRPSNKQVQSMPFQFEVTISFLLL